jgi:phosphoribosyl-ATP pyrophosphohydrolase
MDIFDKLTDTLKQRQQAQPDSSYVASLYAAGLNKILEKVGEEATEVILAAKDADPEADNPELIGEVADLWFHTMVMLIHLNSTPQEVLKLLDKRFGTSGLEEKRSRTP